jgi:molecular chaperone GrpE (heat shock protein)
MDIQKIKEDFKKEIIKAVKRATESKQNKMVEIIDALSAFYSDDKPITLQKQLEELFKLKDEYKSTNNEFCLSLVLNQIEKIETMMKNN